MAKLQDETLKFNVVINDNQAQKQLIELDDANRKINSTLKEREAELKKLMKSEKDNTEQIAKTKAEIDQLTSSYAKNRTEMDKLQKEMGIMALTPKQLRDELAKLSAQFSRAIPGSEAAQKYAEGIKAIKARLGELNETTKITQKETEKTGSIFSNIKGWAVAAVAAIIGLVNGFASFANKIISVRSEFEKYQAVLTNSFESESKGKKAINELADWAAKTPNQLSEATAAFVRLGGNGFKPTMAEMTKMGDLAASQGTAIKDFVEAMVDAEVFEFERLKEFGIKAQQQGDKVVFTFKGARTTIQKDATAIREYLLGLGDMTGIKGSMEAISKTLEGSISNLKDNMDAFYNALGSKVSGLAQSIMNGIGSIFKGLADAMTVTEVDKFDKLSSSVVNLTDNIEPLLTRYDELKSKTNLSAKEQTELQSIVKKVSDTIPSAVTGMDAYGNAISISTDRAREFIEVEKDRLKVMNANAINEIDKALKEKESKLILVSKQINELNATGTFKVGETTQTSLQGGFTTTYRNAKPEEIKDLQEQNRKLLSEFRGYNAEKERLSGDYLDKTRKAQQQEQKELEDSKKQQTKVITESDQQKIEKKQQQEEDLLLYIKKLRAEANDDAYLKAQEENDIWFQAGLDKIDKSTAPEILKIEAMQALQDAYLLKKQETEDKFAEEAQKKKEAATLKEQETERKRNEALAKIQEEEKKKEVKIWEDKLKLYNDFGIKIGAVLGETLADKNKTAKDFLKESILIALDYAKRYVQIQLGIITVGSLAQPDSIASLGATGLIRAAVIAALVEGAFAVTKGIVMNGLEDGGAMNVTRAQDGQNFNATYNPNKRGYVSSPTVLVGEYNKPEYVVSSEKLNVPSVRRMVDIIDTTPTYQLRNINGYADGGYTTSASEASRTERSQTVPTLDTELKNAIINLNQILSNGITAQVGFFDFMNKYRQFVTLQDNITLK